MTKSSQISIVIIVALLAWGAILFNGAGFSQPDDAAAAGSGSYQHPILAATYAANRQFGGWMLTNLVLHIVAALLVLKLSNVYAAALFAAHPLAADAVASAAGRSSLLCAVLMLLSIMALKRERYAAAAAAMIAAYLVKEEALALILLLPTLMWIWGRPVKYMLIGGMAFFLLVQGSLFTKMAKVSYSSTLVKAGMPTVPGLKEHMMIYASGIGKYAGNMIAPTGLTADPDIQFFAPLAIIGLVVLSFAIVFGLFEKNLGMLMFGLSPALLYAIQPLADPILEHRLYFALAGMMILVGTVIPKRAAIVLCIVFVVLANFRAAAYASPMSLLLDSRLKSPNNVRPHFNLAAEYAKVGKSKESEHELREVLRIQPAMTAARHNLAEIYLQRGDISGASRVLDGETENYR